MSCCVANATIDYNAVTIRTKLVDQQGFGGLAKGGSNDIMDRRSSPATLLHERSSQSRTPGAREQQEWLQWSQAEVPTTSRGSGVILTPDPPE
jgi:hypothetical protein